MCNVDSIRLSYFFPPNSAILAFAVKEEKEGKKRRERKEGLERQKGAETAHTKKEGRKTGAGAEQDHQDHCQDQHHL